MWCQVRVIFHTVLIPILQSGSGPNEELFKPLAHALEPAQCSWVREWPSLPTLGSYSPCWTLPHWVYGMTWQPSSRNPSILVSGELSSQEELDLELSVLGPGGKWLFSTSGMCLENCIFFFLEALFHCVFQTSLELVTFLPQPFKCWDFRQFLHTSLLNC